MAGSSESSRYISLDKPIEEHYLAGKQKHEQKLTGM